MRLTEQNAKEIIVDASMQKAVFVYFYMDAPECEKSTLAIKNTIPETSEYISLVEANVQEPVAQSIAMQIGLQTVPALIVMQQGRPVAALQSEDDILNKLKETVEQFMPSASDLLIKEAKELEANGNIAEALIKAKQAFDADNKIENKHYLASLYIKNKNLEQAHVLLDNAGREESESIEYKDLISALTIAEQAADSPALKELEEKHKQEPENTEILIQYSAALAEAGKKGQALEMLFNVMKKDLSNADIKKTFLDLLNTMNGDPLQKEYRRKLYTLMY